MAEATDYLLAAATGIAQGVEKVSTRFFEDDLSRRRKRDELEQEFDIYKQKLPLEEESAIRREDAKVKYVYDENGNIIANVPRFSTQVKTPTPANLQPITKKKNILKSKLVEMLKLGQDPGEVNVIDDTKGSVEETSKDDARNRVNENLNKLKDLYGELNIRGGIVDPSKGGIKNIGARAASSEFGQTIGGFFGTEEQSIRNQINQIRPLLIQDIRQATKMGARGLDSEKELEFYLQAATDPSRDIKSNLNALGVLDDAYGLGIIKGLSKEKGRKNLTNTPEGQSTTSSGLTPEKRRARIAELRAKQGKR